jgi:hypothetical protein
LYTLKDLRKAEELVWKDATDVLGAIPAEKKVSELDSKAKDLSAEAVGVEADFSHQREVNEHKDASLAEYQQELRNTVTRANRLGAALRTEEEKLATVKVEADGEVRVE